ncbi:hypothetical protein BC829DRAFT_399348 [Chytridium lagenaria]|nr:hypothetical protein BC829DRAFT_399348 [Chytridium lagenaria]
MNENWQSPSVWIDIRRDVLPNRTYSEIRSRWGRIVDPKILPVPLTPHEKNVFGPDFSRISRLSTFDGRTTEQLAWEWQRIQGRINKEGFTREEDELLVELAKEHNSRWTAVSKIMKNHPLRNLGGTVDAKLGMFTETEDDQILTLKDEEGLSFFQIAKRLNRRLGSVNTRYHILKSESSNEEPLTVEKRLPGGLEIWERITKKFPNRKRSTLYTLFQKRGAIWTDGKDKSLVSEVLLICQSKEAPGKMVELLRRLDETPLSTFKQVDEADLTPSTEKWEVLEEITEDIDWERVAQAVGANVRAALARRRWMYLAHLDEVLQKRIVRGEMDEQLDDKMMLVWNQVVEAVEVSGLPVVTEKRKRGWRKKEAVPDVLCNA